MDEKVMDWWLTKAFTYGIGTVFTATMLLGLLWVFWTLTRILTARLPGWFDDQAATNAEVRKGMQALVEHTETIHTRTHSTQRGLRALSRAGELFVAKNGERLGIGSDVVVLLRQAKDALRNGDSDRD
jgi:hypothetical protein